MSGLSIFKQCTYDEGNLAIVLGWLNGCDLVLELTPCPVRTRTWRCVGLISQDSGSYYTVPFAKAKQGRSPSGVGWKGFAFGRSVPGCECMNAHASPFEQPLGVPKCLHGAVRRRGSEGWDMVSLQISRQSGYTCTHLGNTQVPGNGGVPHA